MRRKRLFWRLFPSFLVILLLPLVALTWQATYSMRQFYLDKTAADLEARARLVENLILPLLKEQNLREVDEFLKSIGPSIQTRITVILPSGQVVGDSESDPTRMDNHLDRPEIQEALNSNTGSSIRHSDTLQTRMMYVAVPVMEQGRTICVIRTATPISNIDEELSGLKWKIVFAGLLFAGIAAMISYSISRRLSLPLEQLKEGAKRFGEGNLEGRLPSSDLEEVNELVDTMNTMAVQLDDRIQSVVRQRNELKALLSSMIEGVVAVDMERRIVNFNPTAADLLGIDRVESAGQFLQETVRNIHLHKIVEEVFIGKVPVEQEILLFQKNRECFLQVYGTLLKDTRGDAVGALIVLHDVTHLRRLENIRRDFVANVSHELKTPVTSIKASVETLLEGALNDTQDAKRFLNIVLRRTDQLHAIIEDLLSLSRIERDTERMEIQLKEGLLYEILQEAIQACEAQSLEKKLAIHLTCDRALSAPVNAPLLQQAVINLINNAIKYSEPGTQIQVQAVVSDFEIQIQVADQGCGIDPVHFPRLFERFYRVDKGRSRKLGGTGLGLAIVKHITQAHGGQVTVQSQPGKGSTFTIHLPRKSI